MKESFVRFKEANKDTEVGKEGTKEIKKMCKELERPKKSSENASKAKAASKNDD